MTRPATMSAPGIDAKVAFLIRRDVYPTPARGVLARETHMSWVFLTDTEAWKLKKPVRSEYLDFSTAEARRRDSEIEIRLNRRLAPDVYRGLVPLTLSSGGEMEIDGPGEPIDWLIRMRRLPDERMLDHMIEDHTASVDHGRRIGSLLAGFYTSQPPVAVTGAAYRQRFRDDLHSSQEELSRTEFGLSRGSVETATRRLAAFIDEHAALVDERASDRRIVEAHGDLRPEHICLESPPVIVDCLEFSRELRILDAASELAFLALECGRLGKPEIGRAVVETYSGETGDRPSQPLMAFYRGCHAVLRAKVAVWHLRDDAVRDREKWLRRADWYLEQALTGAL